MAILPCNDLDAAQAFFERLGFQVEGSPADYRMSDGMGSAIHLNTAVSGWLVPRGQPVRPLPVSRGRRHAGGGVCRRDHRAEVAGDKPWGMHEFALNGPDDMLVRVEWPTRLRT